MSDAAQRLSAVAGLLVASYPGATAAVASSRAPAPDPTTRVFRVLPSRRRPRLLVPADLQRAAAPALRRVSAVDGRRDVAARRAVALLATSPLADRALPTTITVGPVDGRSIEAYLAEVVGTDVRLAVQVGAERANAKPVLGVYRVRGELEAGFCKVGSTPLAGRLVAAESAALARLATAGLRTLQVPPVLHAGRWRDCETLLLGAVRGSRGAGRGLPLAAMREIAAVGGVADVPLRDSPWVRSVRDRAGRAGTSRAASLRAAVDALVTRDGELPVPHGTWHGDWGPWNMAWSGDRPVVWDWERCAADVPVGMDAAHYVGHPPLRTVGELPRALDALREAEVAAGQVVAPWVPAPALPDTARCVVDAYVLEIACRFAVDAAEVGTAPVARLATWYLEVAGHRLGLQPTQPTQPALAGHDSEADA